MSVEVKSNDIDFPRAGTAKLTSSSLVNALIKDQDAAVGLLRECYTEFSLETLSIDSSGRVVIENEGFTKALQSKLALPTRGLINVICGLSC
ncbi:MAG: hypothetical protein A4E64_02892 [Syntrophorhabdus sp. PtaU1.Bin058]|nr:MAG: hypothetical protein A4E64_02892 [Syntrophorhabdus sp. PtaU1.Bin058]